MEKTLVIINPNAGRKRGFRDWPLIERLLHEAGIVFAHRFTLGTMDAAVYAAEAMQAGVEHIIAVGGDGTLNEVAHGLLQQSPENAAKMRLSLIPIGTGNDWSRTWNIPLGYREAVKVAAQGKKMFQDAGSVRYRTPEGSKQRYFVNVAGVGLDAEVVFDTNRKKELGSAGKIAYLMSLLKAMFSYSPKEVVVSSEGKKVFEGKLYSANIGICRYSGGGMQQVPAALPDDGLMDVTLIRNVGLFKVIRNVKKLYDGSFVKMDEVMTFRTTHMKIASHDKLLIEVDGESLGRPPFEFTLLPRAICISVPPDYTPLG